MAGGKGIIIAGIIISCTGLLISGISAKKAYDDFKAIDVDAKDMQTGTIKLNDISKLNVEVDSGTCYIRHSTTSESYIDYSVSKIYDTNIYDKEDNEIKLTLKRRYKFMMPWVWLLPTVQENKSKIEVYLTDKDYDAYLELNAGKMYLEGDYSFSSLTVDVSAGTFTSSGTITADNLKYKVSAGDLISHSNVTVTNDANVKISAGDMSIDYLEAKSIKIDVSAGDIDAKVKSDTIKFGVSAGDLDLTIVGALADYKTDIDKSAGSCNLSKEDRHKTSGTKSLDGNISAGDADIIFVES